MLTSPTSAQCARGYIRTAQKYRLRPCFAARITTRLRRYATDTIDHEKSSPSLQRVLSVPSPSRYNEIGVQQLSNNLHPQIFTSTPKPPVRDLVQLSKDHLSHHELLGKTNDKSEAIGFDVPQLQGEALDEHFYKLGLDAAEPYLSFAKSFVRTNLPQRPRKWEHRSGWTKYNADGTSEEVDAPQESILSFDVEVMYKESPFAVMACAASPTAFYAWLSPWLLGETENERQLVPLGDISQPRIVIGHNIGYDRARIKEEYDLAQSKNFFIDTMSLHVAVNGMCSQQRPTWMKHQKDRALRDKMSGDESSAELQHLLENKMLSEEEEELWVGRSSINSLRDVAKFHCGVTIDKSARDDFGELSRPELLKKLDELLDYCAADVAITHKVYQKVFPNFLETCPHPVSFGALRHLSSVILPVNETWRQYLQDAERTYQERLAQVGKRLVQLTEAALDVKAKPEVYQSDPWLNQLDWSGQEIKMKKGKKKGDPPVPAARQKKPGMPLWYKDLFVSNAADMNLTVRTRIAPILLKLAWDGYPLVWSDKHGWTYQVPVAQASKYENSPAVRCDMSEEGNLVLKNDHKHTYFKIPHKDGPTARCASPLAKGYLQYFESGKLSSEFALAKEALEMNASCSYWISARDRITSQMVVKDRDRDPNSKDQNLGFILPQVIPMGTITRRAVENTWLTASNAKSNRVGSELKAMIRAPPGYCFVGADVDSEELWIASLVGDAQLKMHGANALGFMTLEGIKSAGTDLHSKTASILGISRNDAKVFNYGRIYGAGLKFASTLLRQFNPSLTEDETSTTATALYKATKGSKTLRRALAPSSFWRGGTESLVFNVLESFAEQERPRTPVLGAGITEALMRRFINKGAYLTSRINWAIQSSGVDYLHLLIVSMDYLIRRYALNARLAITVHDEIRYLVAEQDKYRVAMALQVANLWTRAMFSAQMGIHDLPQSCAFFSAVDIDSVLRKEVDMDCITPSHPTKIPHGESLDIHALLAKGDEAYLDPERGSPIDFSTLSAFERKPTAMATLFESESEDTNTTPTQRLRFLKAQLTSSDADLKALMKDVLREASESIVSESTPTQSSSKSLAGDSNKSGPGTGTPRGRPRKPRVPEIPAYAQPQRAMLLPVEDRWAVGFKRAFAAGERKPWMLGHGGASNSANSSASKKSAATAAAVGLQYVKEEEDGWEV